MPLRLLAARSLHGLQVPVDRDSGRTAANQLREGARAALDERITILQLHDIAILDNLHSKEGCLFQTRLQRVKWIKKC